MHSFLIFHHENPIELQYTELTAGREKRYVVSINGLGVVIRENRNGWEVLGDKTVESTLLHKIGDTIKEHTKQINA